jgi:alkyl hydroperoxide reductase subunit AhpC
VIRDYGVFNEDMIGLKGIAKRAVFVIDKDGVVRHREVLEDAATSRTTRKCSRARFARVLRADADCGLRRCPRSA